MVLALRWVFFTDIRTDSDLCCIRHPWWKVFTARYGLIPYIKQITLRLWNVKASGLYSLNLQTSVYGRRQKHRRCWRRRPPGIWSSRLTVWCSDRYAFVASRIETLSEITQFLCIFLPKPEAKSRSVATCLLIHIPFPPPGYFKAELRGHKTKYGH